MRTAKVFFKDITHKLPLFFPLVALFHLFAFFYTFWNAHTEPFPSIVWLQTLWITAYTTSWIFICDKKRWAAWAYIGITSINIILILTVSSPGMRELVTNTIFPIDILFCFFILFYYKRFK